MLVEVDNKMYYTTNSTGFTTVCELQKNKIVKAAYLLSGCRCEEPTVQYLIECYNNKCGEWVSFNVERNMFIKDIQEKINKIS